MKSRQTLASKLLVACLLLVTATHTVLADDGGIGEEISMCAGMTSCTDCLGAVVCDWYGSICSHYTVMIADIPKYTVDRSTTVEQVCEGAALENADRNLCGSQADCQSCTSTVLSDGVSTCWYYPEFGGCFAERCNMVGCGQNTCKDPVPVPEETSTIDCSSKMTCEECVGDSDNGAPWCAWVPVYFYERGSGCTNESCDKIADPNCFSRKSDEGSANAICTKNDPEPTETTSAENKSVAARTSKSIQMIALVVALLSVAVW